MRILQLAPVWETVPPPGYGGTEAVISVLTEILVKRGHEVLLCASGDSHTSARLFSVVPKSLRSAGLTDMPVQYAAIHVARSLAHASSYDIIHNHNGPPSDLGMAMSSMVDTPMLTTMHNQPAPDTSFLWNDYTGWYNAISHVQAKLLPDLPRAKFAGVAHNSIDVESFPFEAEKADYVLFMGRMCADKAPHLAIRAARRNGTRIVLAGKASHPDEVRYFEAEVKPLLSLDGVEYVGEADGRLKRRLYAGARALLVPIQWDEPFGLVMAEALACGTPVVAFARGAASEIVEHGKTGYLVQDWEEMADAIPGVTSILPEECRSRVESRFGPEHLADRYLEMYEAILHGSSPSRNGASPGHLDESFGPLSQLLLREDYSCVTVHSKGGEIFLDGSVPNFQAKLDIEAQARLVTAQVVHNRLRVFPCVDDPP